MKTKVKFTLIKVIPVRFTVGLWRKVMRRASLDGLKPSVWIRMKLHEITREEEREEDRNRNPDDYHPRHPDDI